MLQVLSWILRVLMLCRSPGLEDSGVFLAHIADGAKGSMYDVDPSAIGLTRCWITASSSEDELMRGCWSNRTSE